MPSNWRLLKKWKAEPLPEYPLMEMKDIPPASCLVWYGVNKWTELFGNRKFRHGFAPPSSHTSTYVGDLKHLNVNKFRRIQNVEPDLTEKRRVDVIVYNLTPAQRDAIVKTCWEDQSSLDKFVVMSDYAFLDVLRFFVKWTKPNPNRDFCTENHVENFLKHGIRTSFQEPYNSGPWSPVEFAVETGLSMYTTYIGEDFK